MTVRRFALSSLFALAAFAVSACPKATEPPAATPEPAATSIPQECNPNSPCPGSTCPASITAASAAVPADACPREGEFQSDVDVFAWNSFIALNWPANLATCEGDPNQSILTGTGPRVWETYTLDSDIFVASPNQPAAWCSPAMTAGLSGRRFGSVRKISASLAETFPGIGEAVGGVLTDQNGRFVRYEIRVNLDEYNYLTKNNLWQASQQSGKTINFPQGPNDNPSRCGAAPCGPVGAMEVKAAWKVLSASEIASGRFYTTQGTVFNDEDGDPSPGANPVTLGLVGFHILHKTESEATWFWSTFEQVDNTTSSFFNPNCSGSNCTANTQNAKKPYTELDPSGNPINAPTQVVRSTPIDKTDSAAPALNAYYRALLKGSVWENYELVSTQWATGGAPAGTPAILANTTLETYIQPNSSCMGCHKGATTTAGSNADFSFLLGEAK